MVRHRSIDYLRQRAREARCRQQLERSTPDAYEIAGASIDAADISAISDVLSGVLSLEQQHVVELAYFVGMSQSEVARQLELPLGTVKSRLRIALSRLRHMCSQSSSGDLIMGPVSVASPLRYASRRNTSTSEWAKRSPWRLARRLWLVHSCGPGSKIGARYPR